MDGGKVAVFLCDCGESVIRRYFPSRACLLCFCPTTGAPPHSRLPARNPTPTASPAQLPSDLSARDPRHPSEPSPPSPPSQSPPPRPHPARPARGRMRRGTLSSSRQEAPPSPSKAKTAREGAPPPARPSLCSHPPTTAHPSLFHPGSPDSSAAAGGHRRTPPCRGAAAFCT